MIRAKGSKRRGYIWKTAIAAFLMLNGIAYLGAYTMTHFKAVGQPGLGFPKPTSDKLPSDVGLSYATQRIPVGKDAWLEAWSIPANTPSTKGTVLLFPGNGGSKATQLLAPAQIFHELGYDTLLIDFRGVGGSSGNTTTLGARESKDVKTAANYAKTRSDSPLILYGVSMGSVAILKAVAENEVQPNAIVLELPFATMRSTVRSRLKAAQVPTFPMTEMLIFWGSIQHGFNGFAHNPVTYAKQITVPTLILQGELDKWTTSAEIDQIFENLRGEKQLAIFPNAGHNLLVTVDKERWRQENSEFLKKL